MNTEDTQDNSEISITARSNRQFDIDVEKYCFIWKWISALDRALFVFVIILILIKLAG